MITKLQKHPILTHANDIKDICKPLRQFNISYFGHARIDNEGKLSAIATNPEFFEHYIKNHYYNADIHMASNDNFGKYVLWDAINCTGESAKMNKEGEEFNVRHTFTIIDRNKAGNNYYHFSTHVPDKSINQVYLSNLELLKLFVLHFNEKINESPVLSDAYHIKFELEKDASSFLLEGNTDPKNQRAEFLHALKLNDVNYKKDLSLRELEVLSWLSRGKTICQIAKILGVTPITINKHIANIKDKTESYTQFQLGSYFTRLLSS